MKSTIALIITTLFLVACGTTKNTNTTKNKTVAATTKPSYIGNAKKEATKPTTPQTPTPPKVIKEVTKTPKVVMEDKENGKTPVMDTDTQLPKEKMKQKEVSIDKPTITTDAVHTSFNELLKDYVSLQGNVNYQGLKSKRSVLTSYIKALGENVPNESWSQEEKLAYWMNAYNAMTIDLILRNMPLTSIKDIKKPWDQRLWKLDKKWYNLNEIEHQILRKMGDARIHFGINCASFSCPPILNEAFTAKDVDQQLDVLARQFVNDKQRNAITGSTVTISKIFSWFSKDFKTDGTLIDFLNKYSDTPINNNARVKYMEYNWALNK